MYNKPYLHELDNVSSLEFLCFNALDLNYKLVIEIKRPKQTYSKKLSTNLVNFFKSVVVLCF